VGGKTQIKIAFATSQGYTILTYNSHHFPHLHTMMVSSSNTHAGIIVGTREDPRRNIRALLNILNTLSAEEIQNQLVYLNNWAS
jgi:hypothetical protein